LILYQIRSNVSKKVIKLKIFSTKNPRYFKLRTIHYTHGLFIYVQIISQNSPKGEIFSRGVTGYPCG